MQYGSFICGSFIVKCEFENGQAMIEWSSNDQSQGGYVALKCHDFLPSSQLLQYNVTLPSPLFAAS
jgi:hypothetical protein